MTDTIGSIVIIYYKMKQDYYVLIGDESKYLSDTIYIPNRRGNKTEKRTDLIVSPFQNDRIASMIRKNQIFIGPKNQAGEYFVQKAQEIETELNRHSSKQFEIKYDGAQNIGYNQYKTQFRYNRRIIGKPSVGFIKGGRKKREEREKAICNETETKAKKKKETDIETVLRETREETGYDLDPQKIIEKRIIQTACNKKYRLFYYHMETAEEAKSILETYRSLRRNTELFDLRFIKFDGNDREEWNEVSHIAMSYFFEDFI